MIILPKPAPNLYTIRVHVFGGVIAHLQIWWSQIWFTGQYQHQSHLSNDICDHFILSDPFKSTSTHDYTTKYSYMKSFKFYNEMYTFTVCTLVQVHVHVCDVIQKNVTFKFLFNYLYMYIDMNTLLLSYILCTWQYFCK